MSTYTCRASLPQGEFQAQATIAPDAIVLRGEGGQCATLPFADLMDMRLLNYRLRLNMRGYEACLYQLGYQTEEFFENLWQAYADKSRESLFVAGALVMQSEFEATVRHAMEAVKKNRRIIFLPDEELCGEPLYRMAIERSAHVRFLRGCNVGRIIHTSSWAAKVAEFFNAAGA